MIKPFLYRYRFLTFMLISFLKIVFLKTLIILKIKKNENENTNKNDNSSQSFGNNMNSKLKTFLTIDPNYVNIFR